MSWKVGTYLRLGQSILCLCISVDDFHLLCLHLRGKGGGSRKAEKNKGGCVISLHYTVQIGGGGIFADRSEAHLSTNTSFWMVGLLNSTHDQVTLKHNIVIQYPLPETVCVRKEE